MSIKKQNRRRRFVLGDSNGRRYWMKFGYHLNFVDLKIMAKFFRNKFKKKR